VSGHTSNRCPFASQSLAVFGLLPRRSKLFDIGAQKTDLRFLLGPHTGHILTDANAIHKQNTRDATYVYYNTLILNYVQLYTENLKINQKLRKFGDYSRGAKSLGTRSVSVGANNDQFIQFRKCYPTGFDVPCLNISRVLKCVLSVWLAIRH